jgi:putative oxidoreductase
MLSKLIKTNDDPVMTILRLMLGIVFLPHGAQKMLGMFGGSGFSSTLQMFETGMHIPAVFAFLAIAAEFFGAIGLIFGFLSRIAAFGIFVNMAVAIYKVHVHNGLFMNWTGKQAGEGFEYHLLVLAMTLAIMIAGAGAFSIDGMLYQQTTYRF